MDYNNFYSFNNKYLRNVLQFSLPPELTNPEEIFRGKYFGTSSKIELKKVRGKKKQDLISLNYASLNILSGKFWKMVEENRLTGVSGIPIKTDFEEINDFKIITVTGKSGPIINEMSIKTVKTAVLNPNYHYDTWIGYYFDLKTWDGSDFFSPQGTQMIFITKRVHDLVVDYGLTNILMTSISELENYELLIKNI